MSDPGAGAAGLLGEEPYEFQKLLGYRFTAWESDFARVELDLTSAHMNRHAIPHGGVYAVLLDTALGFSGCYTGDAENRAMAMTLSLTTNFLSRPTGARLIAEGRRTGGGARSFFAEGTVRDELGELVATGSGVFRIRQGG